MLWILTVFQNFTWFTAAMPIQGCEVARNRRLFGGVGFLTTLGVGVDVLSDCGSPIWSLLHRTPKLGISVESVQFLIKLLAFLSVTSMCLYKYIIPSVGISEATTEKLKLPQNISLASFTSSLQWAGLNCPRFLIVINRLCFLEQKITFIWKQHFYRFSTVQY